jgi:hypothetical protein
MTVNLSPNAQKLLFHHNGTYVFLPINLFIFAEHFHHQSFEVKTAITSIVYCFYPLLSCQTMKLQLVVLALATHPASCFLVSLEKASAAAAQKNKLASALDSYAEYLNRAGVTSSTFQHMPTNPSSIPPAPAAPVPEVSHSFKVPRDVEASSANYLKTISSTTASPLSSSGTSIQSYQESRPAGPLAAIPKANDAISLPPRPAFNQNSYVGGVAMQNYVPPGSTTLNDKIDEAFPIPPNLDFGWAVGRPR